VGPRALVVARMSSDKKLGETWGGGGGGCGSRLPVNINRAPVNQTLCSYDRLLAAIPYGNVYMIE
jgi:hypothetical protein